MSPHNNDHSDDEDFDAFLQGKGDLAQTLQQLPQPTPPAALTAAIMADAETALRQRSPANDPFISGPRQRRAPRHFMRRVQFALAATVLVAVAIGLLWQSQSSDTGPLVIAQAPQPAAAPSQVPVAPMPAPSDTRKPPAVRKHAPPTVIAQADTPEGAPNWTTRSGPSSMDSEAEPADAPELAPTPEPSAPADASLSRGSSIADNPKAKVWLTLIDELIKAGKERDALEEWEKFRKTYPHYPVPEKLNATIKTLKK